MIDWEDSVRRYHLLGLWHATRYLATISTVKDPSESAADAVQDAWLSLWRQGKFSKGLFVTAVLGCASNVARRSRPIEIRKGGGDQHKQGPGTQARTTDTFPVQIFGGYLSEITMDEAIEGPCCGDE